MSAAGPGPLEQRSGFVIGALVVVRALVVATAAGVVSGSAPALQSSLRDDDALPVLCTFKYSPWDPNLAVHTNRRSNQQNAARCVQPGRQRLAAAASKTRSAADASISSGAVFDTACAVFSIEDKQATYASAMQPLGALLYGLVVEVVSLFLSAAAAFPQI